MHPSCNRAGRRGCGSPVVSKTLDKKEHTHILHIHSHKDTETHKYYTNKHKAHTKKKKNMTDLNDTGFGPLVGDESHPGTQAKLPSDAQGPGCPSYSGVGKDPLYTMSDKLTTSASPLDLTFLAIPGPEPTYTSPWTLVAPKQKKKYRQTNRYIGRPTDKRTELFDDRQTDEAAAGGKQKDSDCPTTSGGGLPEGSKGGSEGHCLLVDTATPGCSAGERMIGQRPGTDCDPSASGVSSTNTTKAGQTDVKDRVNNGGHTDPSSNPVRPRDAMSPGATNIARPPTAITNETTRLKTNQPTNRTEGAKVVQFIQSNLQHKHLATATLCRQLEVETETIALIQEPWVRGKTICGFGSCSGKIFSHSSNEPPRTCIYIPRCITALLLTQYCSRDLTAVKIQNGIQQGWGLSPKPLVLASAYMPIEDQIPAKELMDLIIHCEDNDIDLIIAVDSNAHHNLWGSTINNKRGEQLVSYLLTTNLVILNRGAEPTFVTSRYQTIIDLTLASPKAADQVKQWHVSDEPSLSDHRRICYNIDLTITPQIPKRNPRKTNRLKYKSLLTNKVGDMTPQDIDNIDSIEDSVKNITQQIKECYEQACPLKTNSTKQTPKNSWWGPDLERMRTKLRHLFNRAMNTRQDHDWDKFKEAQYKYNKRVREKDSNSWQKFCTNIESNDNAARIRKILADDNTRTLGSLKKADGTYTKNNKEISETLIETHFPGCRIVQYPNWTIGSDIRPTEDDWDIANRIVTPERINWAIDTFHPFKSGGTDSIFPALLQWGKTQLTPWLERIYKACIAYKYIPLAWREVKVVFLPKPGKSDYTLPKSFRPISLTSFLLKTLERLVDRFLRDGTLKHRPLHPHQHAYSTGKSTETALHSVVVKIEHDLENGLSTLGTFIDIEGAFDKTTFDSIDKALGRYYVPGTLRSWIRALLEQRIIQLDINGSTKGIVARGCPQGGVLSPILWNLVADDLITKLNQNGFYTIGYADDLTILISGKLVNTLYEVMQRALRLIEKWCKENELTVNPKKTEMVLFTNKRKLELCKPPTLFNTCLKLSTEVKYLGVILDSKLSWKRHTEDKIRKSLTILNQCKRMLGKTWGLKPKIMKWLYLAVVRSSLTYAALIWWPRTLLTTAQQELQKFQRQACLAITGCMSTTPTAALEVILGIPPLHLHIREEATLAALRLRTSGLWKDQNTQHTKILTQGFNKEPRLEWKCDRTRKQHILERSYKINSEKNLKPVQDSIEVYTDGSKTKTGTGAGAYCRELNIKISHALGKDNSVFQAECVGITTAAIAMANRQVTNFKIIINSDSQAALKALASTTTTSQLVLDCHQALEALAVSNDITLQWIKGHDGDPGNEAADELARRATTLKVMGPEPIVPIPFSEYKTWLHELTLREHSKLWTNATDCRQTREVLPNINQHLTNKLLRLDRGKLRKVVGLITGHSPLNKHLYVVGVTDSPLCRACMETEETPTHVLLECTGVADQRRRYIGSPASLREVLGDLGGLLGFWSELGWLE